MDIAIIPYFIIKYIQKGITFAFFFVFLAQEVSKKGLIHSRSTKTCTIAGWTPSNFGPLLIISVCTLPYGWHKRSP